MSRFSCLERSEKQNVCPMNCGNLFQLCENDLQIARDFQTTLVAKPIVSSGALTTSEKEMHLYIIPFPN